MTKRIESFEEIVPWHVKLLNPKVEQFVAEVGAIAKLNGVRNMATAVKLTAEVNARTRPIEVVDGQSGKVESVAEAEMTKEQWLAYLPAAILANLALFYYKSYYISEEKGNRQVAKRMAPQRDYEVAINAYRKLLAELIQTG